MKMIDPARYFTVDGSLKRDAPTYVCRPADDELLRSVLNGEFCYVLNARQMGKSSLMVRTEQALRERGDRVAIIDANLLSTASVEQWYFGLVTFLEEKLDLDIDVQAWWQKHHDLALPLRFREFIHDVVLDAIPEPWCVVIFIDEIDVTRQFRFRNDFFRAVRAIYNLRSRIPAFKRITFVLLGVATPNDLIRDRRYTPFNIGRGIELTNLAYDDAHVLREGLEAKYPSQGDFILRHIYGWTSGQPYLTQRLCADVVETDEETWSEAAIDDLVRNRFLSDEGRRDSNLSAIRNRVAGARAEARRMLRLYRDIYRGQAVARDPDSETQNRLALTGLTVVEDGRLAVRNRLYREVFDLEWVREMMPTNRALWAMAGAIALALVMVAAAVRQFNQPPNTVAALAEIQVRTFRSTASPQAQLAALDTLVRLGYEGRVLELFYSLPSNERIGLFAVTGPVDIEETAFSQAARTIVSSLDESLPEDEERRILDAIIAYLAVHRETLFTGELAHWRDGRNFVISDHLPEAIQSYATAAQLNVQAATAYAMSSAHITETPVAPFPGQPQALILDRALVYLALNDYPATLANLDLLVESARTRAALAATVQPTLTTMAGTPVPPYATARAATHLLEPEDTISYVRGLILGDHRLSDQLFANSTDYPHLAAINDLIPALHATVTVQAQLTASAVAATETVQQATSQASQQETSQAIATSASQTEVAAEATAVAETANALATTAAARSPTPTRTRIPIPDTPVTPRDSTPTWFVP